MKRTLKTILLGATVLGGLNDAAPKANAAECREFTDRQEILRKFGEGDFAIPQLDSSIQRVIVQFGDPGFDGGDIFENIAAYRMVKDAITVVVTSLWKPFEKAALLELVAKQLGREDILFCSGSGCYTDDGKNFDQLYPAWPKGAFGDPAHKNPSLDEATKDSYKGIYNEQLQSYVSVFGEAAININKFPEQDPVSFLKKVVEPFGDKYALEFFISGPTTDPAKILSDDQLSKHVRVLRGVMGGGFGKFGSESRLGYNFVIDPNGTKKLIDLVRKNNIPTLVVTSQTCSTIPVQKDDFTRFMGTENKTPLGQAVAIGWDNWNKHMSLKRGTAVIDYTIPDLITVKSSFHPEHIGVVKRGYYNIYPEKAMKEGIHMLSPNAKELFDTVIDDTSPLFFVESIKDAGDFYKILLSSTMDILVNKEAADNSGL